MRIPSYVRVPALFFIIYGAVELIVESKKPAVVERPEVALFLLLVLLVLIAIEVIVGAVERVMFQTLSEEAKERYLAKKEKKIEFKWLKGVYNRLLDQRPIEEEGEIILDHNYDGIKELDNSLPPWWLWLFYVTIFFSIVYLAKYHIFNGNTQDQEYEIEVAEAKAAIEEWKKTAKDLVDVNTVTLLTDASDLSAGQQIFTINCVACHQADGGGGIGPNLTDEYWILGGGIKNVFRTISEGGRDGKGMISWKQTLKPAEMAQVASYILSLQGTTPASPKDPEGEIWVDPDAPEKEPTQEVAPEKVSDTLDVAMN